MCGYIIVLNMVSYFAGQNFTYVEIEEDERALINAEQRAEIRHMRIKELREADRAALDSSFRRNNASYGSAQPMESQGKFA